MSDNGADDFSERMNFLRETKNAVEDLSEYAVAKAAMQPDVLDWVSKVSAFAAEYRAKSGCRIFRGSGYGVSLHEAHQLPVVSVHAKTVPWYTEGTPQQGLFMPLLKILLMGFAVVMFIFGATDNPEVFDTSVLYLGFIGFSGAFLAHWLEGYRTT